MSWVTSLPVDVYKRMELAKQEGESFGDLVMRLLNAHEGHPSSANIEAYAGIFDNEASDEWGEIENIIYQKREYHLPEASC